MVSRYSMAGYPLQGDSLSTRPTKIFSCTTGYEWYTLGRVGQKDTLSDKPKWRNRQTRTTQNRVPSGNEGSIPSFGTQIIPGTEHPPTLEGVLVYAFSDHKLQGSICDRGII